MEIKTYKQYSTRFKLQGRKATNCPLMTTADQEIGPPYHTTQWDGGCKQKGNARGLFFCSD